MTVLAMLILAASSCAAPGSRAAREAGIAGGGTTEGKINEAQLQESLFRFANRFSAGVNEGLKVFESSHDARLREQALTRRLLYNSAALDITMGASPEANLLDMVTFVELTRSVWQEYWAPKVFKSGADTMSRAFEVAHEQVWALAAEVLDAREREELASLIRRWRERYPKMVNVENVRLSEFASEVGSRAEDLSGEASGLGAAIRSATTVGDRTLLFSERALFYAQRAPFLWQMQLRAATRGVLADVERALAPGERILENEPKLRALLQETERLMESGTKFFAETNGNPNAMKATGDAFAEMGRVLQELNRAISLRGGAGPPSAALSTTGKTIDAGLDRLLWKLFSVAGALIVLLGLVLLASRLAYWRIVRRWSASQETPEHSGDRKAA